MSARHPQGDNLPTVNVSPIERAISAAAGSFLLFNAIAHKGKLGWVKAIGGAALLYRGTSGYCPVYKAMGRQQRPVPYKTVNIRTKLIVNKKRDEVYSFWRNLENLPLFMTHLESVEKIDEKFSQWKAKFPKKVGIIQWKAEIVKEVEGSFIGWSSTEDATIKNAGKVQFTDALGGRGTEINVVISYHPPLGIVGAGIAKLFSKKLEKLVRKDIQNFKSYIETGVNEKQKAIKSDEPSKAAPVPGKLINSAVEGLISGLNKSVEEPAIGQF